jgi:N-acetylmuramoyl-L-alanine amidase
MKIFKAILLQIIILFMYICYSYSFDESYFTSCQKVNVLINDEQFKDTINVYKTSNNVEYFLIKDIATIYNANIIFNNFNNETIIDFNNKKIYLNKNNNEIIFDKESKKIFNETIYVKDDIYISGEIFSFYEFTKITNTYVEWDNISLTLNVLYITDLPFIKYFEQDNVFRITIQLDEKNKYIVSENDSEIIVKIFNNKLKNGFINIDNCIIKTIQSCRYSDFSIIKINVEKTSKFFKTYEIYDPYRIIIDIVNENKKIKKDLLSNNFDKNNKYDKTNHFKKDKKIIVLDAGHGGKDSGAIGIHGTKEKDINLDVVHILKSIFDKDKNYIVFLTREDDTFVELYERPNIANRHNADLFISIHCNGFFKAKNGFEIYFMDYIASDASAAMLAKFENSVVELEEKINYGNVLLRNMLLSITDTENINESSKLCGFISYEVSNRVKIENKGIRQANFAVLRLTKMPAILVEIAYIDNYIEEQMLLTKEFRLVMATSIYEGVVKYYASKQYDNEEH